MPRQSVVLVGSMSVLCEICQENISKYKCASCLCPYCSLNCWKKHKENVCGMKKSPEDINQPQCNNEKTKYFTEDTVKASKLRLLGESKIIRMILNNKYLRKTLIAVDNALYPDEAIQASMKDPEFVEFVDECLKIVEDSNNSDML